MPWRRQTAPSSTPGQDPLPAELLTWANALDVTMLSDKTVKDAERFLRDYRHMPLYVRREAALRLRSVIAAQVTPPLPPTVGNMDIIATVVSAHRRQFG
jgi:hypothetical protein